MKILALGDSLINGYGVDEPNKIRNIIAISLEVEVVNKGINGATSDMGLDLLEAGYTWALISYGTNDVFQGKFDNYFDNMSAIIEKLLSHGTKVILISVHPIMYDYECPDLYFFSRHDIDAYQDKTPNEYLESVYRVQKKLVKTYDIEFVDLFYDENFKCESMILNINHNTNDGVHYSNMGSKYVASKVLDIIKNG